MERSGLFGAKPRIIGTPVRCPVCHYDNLAIDIWCESCGTPLDWDGHRVEVTTTPTRDVRRNQPQGGSFLQSIMSSTRSRSLSSGQPSYRNAAAAPATVRREAAGQVYCGQCGTAVDQRAPFCPRCGNPMEDARPLNRMTTARPQLGDLPVTRTVAAVVGVLLIAVVAVALLPGIRGTLAGVLHLNKTTTTAAPPRVISLLGSPDAAAISGLEAKTGLKFATAKCAPNPGCLTFVSETIGQDAAAVILATGATNGRQCVGYTYASGGAWHFLNSVCGLPAQLSPLVGRDAGIKAPGSCGNVRKTPSPSAPIVACLRDATTVHLDGGPIFANGYLWWHEPNGWISHNFLVSS